VTDAVRCALIAIDWGTTSARAYRLDASGSKIGVLRAMQIGKVLTVDNIEKI